ncbi:MAG: hypothetical protein NC247_12245 [Ruminococcus flavefaciens]|nr:hypothetical protein [Ruminococcus flavefaciens]
MILVTDISGHKKPYDNCITRNVKSKQKRGKNMNESKIRRNGKSKTLVKVKKCKKSPAPLVAEQVKIAHCSNVGEIHISETQKGIIL